MMANATAEKNSTPLGVQSAANKAGENIGERAVNWVTTKLREKYGQALVLTGSVYRRYLENAYTRYNKVKTLVTGLEPRSIIGQNSLYIQVDVKHKKKVYDTSTVHPLLGLSKNILICGSGGAGKSMLMRYLFLNTVNRGEYIPVLLELRKIADTSSSDSTFMDLIYKCMSDFDTELPREQFEYSLRLGKYVFFLDGFDEIKSALADSAAEAIQNFASKYPENAYIMTSRPDRDFAALETFTKLDSMPLSKIQAISLSEKFWVKDEKVVEFCRQLDEKLFDQHRDFAQNPLLLSMMFLTFMHNNNIPDHRVDFYDKCYNALYSMHDNQNKGTYEREFDCRALNEHTFKQLFARFCYITYIHDLFEFKHEEIIDWINQCLHKLNISEVTAQQYLNDLRKVVCLIVVEGNTYRFSHRSFQTYFAAVYILSLPDELQKVFYKDFLTTSPWRISHELVVMANQLDSQRFMLNALEEPLRSLKNDMNSSDQPEKLIFHIFSAGLEYSYRREGDGKKYIRLIKFGSNITKDKAYTSQSALHIVYGLMISDNLNDKIGNALIHTIFRYEKKRIVDPDPDIGKGFLVNQLDSVEWLTDMDRNLLIQDLIRGFNVARLIEEINCIIQNIDDMRTKMQSSNSILDSL